MATAPSFAFDPTVELRLQILAMCGGDVGKAKVAFDFVTAGVPANDTAPAEEKPKRGRQPKVEPEAAPTEEPKPAKLPEEAAAESRVEYAQVRDAVVKLGAAKGRAAVVKVLDSFGVDHGSKLTEDQWPAALAALTTALEG
jgi:hypothetical protein